MLTRERTEEGVKAKKERERVRMAAEVDDARVGRLRKMSPTERDRERLFDLFDFVVATLTTAEGRSGTVRTDALITPDAVRNVVELAISKVQHQALDALREKVAAGKLDPWQLS